jgi:hypothetical protein
VRVLLFQSRELRDYALRPWDTRELQTRAAVEAHTKSEHPEQGRRHPDAGPEGGRPIERVEALRQEIAHIEREMLGGV